MQGIMGCMHSLEIIIDHVMQLSSHLHTRGTTTHDHKGQQALALLGAGIRVRV
jgi:hypothetical protein